MVNTFIVGDIPFTVDVLDAQRRFKQAVEAKEILLTIQRKKENPDGRFGFKNHPVVVMWENHVEYLKYYYNLFYDRLKADGVKMLKLQRHDDVDECALVRPWFLDFMPLVYSHRARLYQKDPNHYRDKFEFPEEYLRLGYIWIRRDMEYYLDKSPDVIADVLDKQYVCPRYCDAMYMSGTKKGTSCGRILKVSSVSGKCGLHSKEVNVLKKKRNVDGLRCEGTYKSGKRMGERCDVIVNGGLFCKRHFQISLLD